MQIERTRDRVILTAEEVQAVLKEHLETKTGRKIDGNVNFQQSDRGAAGFQTSVYAHLTYQTQEAL